MAITSALSLSWVRDLGKAAFDHTTTTGHVFKVALYVSAATLSSATTAYSATNEVPNGGGYTTAGAASAQVSPVLSGSVTLYDFGDVSWTSATLTDVRGLEMYDDTHASNASVFVIDFGAAQAVTAGTLTVQWPVADATNAIIRMPVL